MLTKLSTIALNGRGNPQVKAAEIILAYAWGKPTQPIAGDPADGNDEGGGSPIPLFQRMTRAELQREVEKLELELSEEGQVSTPEEAQSPPKSE